MTPIRVSMNRLAMMTAGVAILALLAVGAAAAEPTTTAIKVACSQQALVDAINEANTAGGGKLDLATKCHYRLKTSPDSSENGLPVITTNIKINGNQSTIDGTNSFRVFEIDSPGGLSANHLTITNGSADVGGGIANFGGTVLLNQAQVNGNAALVAGGGIASASIDPDFNPSNTVAALTVRNSTVSNNQQTSDDPNVALGGGGILNMDGNATLNNTQVKRNDAEGFVGGGIANGDYVGEGGQTVLTVTQSQVNANTAPNAGGGGIQNGLGSVTVNSSEVNGNTALNGGGIASGTQGNPDGTAELKVNNSEVDSNTATAAPQPPGPDSGPPIAAGGIANGGDAVLNNTEVNRNTASLTSGAGIVNHATMTINHSEVNGNTAAGTGIAASGGGILNVQGPPNSGPANVLTLNHSTVDNNTAGGNGGGIANGSAGMLVGGQVTLKDSEVRHNTAAHGGGIFNNGGTVTLSASIVTGNNPDNCEPTNTIAGCTN